MTQTKRHIAIDRLKSTHLDYSIKGRLSKRMLAFKYKKEILENVKLKPKHKKMLKNDAMENQDIYSMALASVLGGGFDPQIIVESEVYIEINEDLGNKCFPNDRSQNEKEVFGMIQEEINDQIKEYCLTLKLDPYKVGKFSRENGLTPDINNAWRVYNRRLRGGGKTDG